MQLRIKFKIALRTLLSIVLMSAIFASPSNALDLPPSQKVLFILDVSGSTNSAQLWREYLRPSLIKKLSQPFGYPLGKGIENKNDSPSDISVTTVQANSIDAPIFNIVTKSDAKILWDAIDKAGGGKTSSARLKEIISDIFSGTGAWTRQSSYLSRSKIIIPSMPKCVQSALNGFKNSRYFDDEPLNNKKEMATAVCRMSVTVGKRILQVDNYFKNPKCAINSSSTPKTCSDIIGAIYLATSAASDLVVNDDSDERSSSYCIAIASDMLNKSLGVASDSPLDSRYVAMKVTSTKDARTLGSKAAVLANVKFPKGIKIRVSILGQGTGPKPLPLDKNSYLAAYWDGFWESAGVRGSNSVRSLDEACS
jgi:hypothetical protein